MPTHVRLGHRGVGAQHLFHLAGKDVEAGGLDHALAAADEVEEPVVVPPPDIAGVQPDPPVGVPAERLRRGRRIVQVAQHDGRPRHADLSRLAHGQLVARLRARRSRRAYRGGDAHAPGSLEMQRHRHDAGDVLGEPVPLQESGLASAVGEHLVEPLLDRRRERVAAGEGGPDAGEIGAAKRPVPGERVVERRHAGDEVRPRAPDQARDGLRRELRHQDHPASAHQRGVDQGAQPEPVKQRQRREHAMPLPASPPTGRSAVRC